VTGDDILRDEIMIDNVIDDHLFYSNDVTLTRNMPYGTDTELFTFDTIRTIMSNALYPQNTEYLEWYLENDRYFSVKYVDSNYTFDPKLRITLDYPEDLIFFERIFQRFKGKNDFTLPDVLEYLNKNPEIPLINNFLSPKTVKEKDNLVLHYDKGKLVDTTLLI
jgi:spore coat polysaccharide biosynthesis protein SpsF (cytidylyltransferase family)